MTLHARGRRRHRGARQETRLAASAVRCIDRGSRHRGPAQRAKRHSARPERISSNYSCSILPSMWGARAPLSDDHILGTAIDPAPLRRGPGGPAFTPVACDSQVRLRFGTIPRWQRLASPIISLPQTRPEFEHEVSTAAFPPRSSHVFVITPHDTILGADSSAAVRTPLVTQVAFGGSRDPSHGLSAGSAVRKMRRWRANAVTKHWLSNLPHFPFSANRGKSNTPISMRPSVPWAMRCGSISSRQALRRSTSWFRTGRPDLVRRANGRVPRTLATRSPCRYRFFRPLLDSAISES